MATITGLTAARMLAIEAASVVDGNIVGDDLILTKHDASTINAGNVRGSRSNRNRIINGDFAVNQRGFSSSTVSTAYGLDRWQFWYTGGTVTYTTQTPALGDLPESAKAFARLSTSGQAAAADFSWLNQPIESVRTLSGKTVTVSFWAKAASGTPKVVVELIQGFGTGGSPSGQVNAYGGQITLSTAWARYSISVSLPSIAGKTLGTANDDRLTLALWTSAGSNWNARTGSLGIQSTTIDFWGVQVEEGSTLSPFEQEDYATNLRRCQRYYYRLVVNEETFGQVESSTIFKCCVRHPVPMRVAPVPSLSGSAPIISELGGGSSTVTSLIAWGGPMTTNMLGLTATCSGGGLTATRMAVIQPNGAIEVTAEL